MKRDHIQMKKRLCRTIVLHRVIVINIYHLRSHVFEFSNFAHIFKRMISLVRDKYNYSLRVICG